NRPNKKNALTHEMYARFYDVLFDAINDASVGCVVLTGAGTDFCAGGDIGRMSQSNDASKAEKTAAMRKRVRVVELLHNSSKPTIAMIRGVAVGAGMSLALACDLRYSDDSLKMRTGFIGIGLPGDYGIHHFLPRIVGEAK